ncbi:hypothetical protein [Streptomyces sp. NPDC059398]|uniref:hypothetical protein n=1 Tax=Streptomyces sp. NPDC059398 TaxID=3346820 RepID=UPI0036C5D267
MEKIVIGADHVHNAATVRRRQRQFIPPSELHPDLATRIDTALLDQLFYATVDECHECRSTLLDRVASDVGSTCKLIDWTCLITSEMHGGLPAELVDEDASADTVFRPSATFRQLAAKYHNSGLTNAIHDACTAAQHREAADTAVPLVDGLQMRGTDFLSQ